MEVIFETPRLIIRKTELSDVQNMINLNSDPLVTQFTGDGPFNSEEQARGVAEYIIDQYKNVGYGRWMLQLKPTNEFIGWCGLKYLTELQETDLGYRLVRKHWGKGYATEAAKECVRYGFESLNLNRIIAHASGKIQLQ